MTPFDDDPTLEGSSPPFFRGAGLGPAVGVRDPEVRAAMRTIRLLAVGLFVALVGTAVFVTSRIVGSGGNGDRAPRPRVVATTLVGDQFVEIGPLPGTAVDTYVSERRRALASAGGERVAVVSLRSYRTEEEARRAAGSAEIVAMLVAAPGGTPAAVTGTLQMWAEEQRQHDTSERDELRRLIPTVDDPVFKADFESEVLRLDEAIGAIDPEGDVVFGLVLRGPTAGLQELANERDVRLVDVAPSGEAAENAVYRGIRPEETAKTNVPPTRASAPG